MSRRPVVALAGNPNTGKTSIFNRLTGSRQHVGNWPGKTVERKVGRCRYHRPEGTVEIDVVDLPGTYSLSASSLEEEIARDFLVDEHPDAVIVVVDATNLERNLYLVVQVRELGVPAVMALNMYDRVEQAGTVVDLAALGEALGVAAIPTVARDGTGIDVLTAAVGDLVAGEVGA